MPQRHQNLRFDYAAGDKFQPAANHRRRRWLKVGKITSNSTAPLPAVAAKTKGADQTPFVRLRGMTLECQFLQLAPHVQFT